MSSLTWLYAAAAALLVALGAAGLLKHRAGRKLGPRLAEAAPVLGFLAGFVALAQGLPFLNGVPQHQVGEVGVLALGLAIALASLPPGPRLGRYLALGAGLLAVLWQVPGGQVPGSVWLQAGAAALLAWLALDRLVLLAPSGAAALLILAMTAFGLGLIGMAAHAGLLGGMALALAAACAGLLVWLRPWPKAKLGLAVPLGAGMVFVALGFATMESAARTPWTLALLLPAFWAETIMRLVPALARLGKKKPQRVLVLAGTAALPVVVAIALAFVLP
jgi:hypothetical protein